MSLYLKAALWMCGAIVSFSCMAVAGRFASHGHDTFEIMFYRSVIGCVIVVAVTTATSNWSQITTNDLKTHFMRNIAHFIGQNLWFFGLTVMPLSQLFALEFTTPVWVLLLSPLLLGTPLRPMAMLAAAIAFAGILLVARPWAEAVGPGFLPAALCAIFFALTFIFTKKLTQHHSIFAILFYLTLMQAFFGAAMAMYDGEIALPTSSSALYLVVIGIAGLTAHFSITKALQVAPATIVAPFDFVRLPVIILVGYLIFDEPMDLFILFGAILIFSGNYLNIMTEKKNN